MTKPCDSWQVLYTPETFFALLHFSVQSIPLIGPFLHSHRYTHTHTCKSTSLSLTQMFMEAQYTDQAQCWYTKPSDEESRASVRGGVPEGVHRFLGRRSLFLHNIPQPGPFLGIRQLSNFSVSSWQSCQPPYSDHLSQDPGVTHYLSNPHSRPLSSFSISLQSQ